MTATVILILLLGITTLFSIGCIFTIKNLMRKVEEYEDIVVEGENTIADFEKLFSFFQKELNDSIVKLKQVDKKGSFSSDDEVGFAFRTIELVFKTLNSFLTYYTKDAEEDKKEE